MNRDDGKPVHYYAVSTIAVCYRVTDNGKFLSLIRDVTIPIPFRIGQYLWISVVF